VAKSHGGAHRPPGVTIHCSGSDRPQRRGRFADRPTPETVTAARSRSSNTTCLGRDQHGIARPGPEATHDRIHIGEHVLHPPMCGRNSTWHIAAHPAGGGSNQRTLPARVVSADQDCTSSWPTTIDRPVTTSGAPPPPAGKRAHPSKTPMPTVAWNSGPEGIGNPSSPRPPPVPGSAATGRLIRQSTAADGVLTCTSAAAVTVIVETEDRKPTRPNAHAMIPPRAVNGMSPTPPSVRTERSVTTNRKSPRPRPVKRPAPGSPLRSGPGPVA
jgi:hypothetical protein